MAATRSTGSWAMTARRCISETLICSDPAKIFSSNADTVIVSPSVVGRRGGDVRERRAGILLDGEVSDGDDAHQPVALADGQAPQGVPAHQINRNGYVVIGGGADRVRRQDF